MSWMSCFQDYLSNSAVDTAPWFYPSIKLSGFLYTWTYLVSSICLTDNHYCIGCYNYIVNKVLVADFCHFKLIATHFTLQLYRIRGRSGREKERNRWNGRRPTGSQMTTLRERLLTVDKVHVQKAHKAFILKRQRAFQYGLKFMRMIWRGELK